MTNDILSNAPQAIVIILGTVTFALFCWLPQPTPVPIKDECEKPIYLPTASDAPSYSWQWPITEQEDEPRHYRRHRRG